jgi:hypothetical protein
VEELSNQLEEGVPQQSGPSYPGSRTDRRSDYSAGNETQDGGENDSRMKDHYDFQSKQLAEEFGRLTIGKDGSLYIGNRFWVVLSNEVCLLSPSLTVRE